MSRILLFVLAAAYVNANISTGFFSYTTSSAIKAVDASSTIKTLTPDAPAAVASSTENSYFFLLPAMKAEDSQKQNAKIIFEELHLTLTKAGMASNVNLAKYLIATAYTDVSLVPAEEKFNSEKSAVQKTYFADGFMGRGYVHFTGAFNYQRFSQYIGVDLISDPAQLNQPRIAAKVLVFGAINGKFTGIRIGQFFLQPSAPETLRARTAINGNYRDKDVELTYKSLFGSN